jgi:hypothetical protein
MMGYSARYSRNYCAFVEATRRYESVKFDSEHEAHFGDFQELLQLLKWINLVCTNGKFPHCMSKRGVILTVLLDDITQIIEYGSKST